MAQARRWVLSSSHPLHLTRRERDIVLAILEGCTNREMAKRFGIGEQSVKNRLSQIYEKVGVSAPDTTWATISDHLTHYNAHCGSRTSTPAEA